MWRMKRRIIKIEHVKCNGCGRCIPNRPEGAIQLIDGKARLVSDLFCDGLGACLGHCPEGAILIEEREAEAYDEGRVMENIVRQGENTTRAHLEHLRDHKQEAYLMTAVRFLREKGIKNPLEASRRNQ
jgi:ferredoxin